MDREQVIEEARRLAAQGDYEAACVLRWLAPGETPGATMPPCSPKASPGNHAASTSTTSRR